MEKFDAKVNVFISIENKESIKKLIRGLNTLRAIYNQTKNHKLGKAILEITEALDDIKLGTE